MIHEKVFRLASVIAQAGEEETSLLEALCTAAEAQTAQRLREGCTAGDCGDAFCCAAAMLAAAGMLTCRGGGEVEQMQAGDVSLRLGPGGGACEAAAVLRRQCALLMAPYWEDDGFAFAGVRG